MASNDRLFRRGPARSSPLRSTYNQLSEDDSDAPLVLRPTSHSLPIARPSDTEPLVPIVHSQSLSHDRPSDTRPIVPFEYPNYRPNTSVPDNDPDEPHVHSHYSPYNSSPKNDHVETLEQRPISRTSSHAPLRSSTRPPSSETTHNALVAQKLGGTSSDVNNEEKEQSPTPHGQPHSKRARTFKAFSEFFYNGWKLEVGSSVISGLFLVALIAFLHSVDGIPLANSMWGLLSPNAIVSILSFAVKATLLFPIGECISQLKWAHSWRKPQPLYNLQMYDSASRGPLGALLFFLIRPSMLHATAYLCCLVTLIAITLDPFSQQILQYAGGPVPQPNLAGSLNASQLFDLGQNPALDGSSGYLNLTNSRDLDSQSAVLAAMLGSPGTMPFDCPSNECVFPPSSGLAIEGSCSDVTNNISTNCDFPDNGTADGVEGTYEACNVIFPDKGPTLSAVIYYNDTANPQRTKLNMTAIVPDYSCEAPGCQVKMQQPMLMSAYVLRFPAAKDPAANMADHPNPNAAWFARKNAQACWLRVVAAGNTGAHVVNGTLQFANKSTSPLRLVGDSFDGSTNHLHYQVQDDVPWPHSNYSMNPTDLSNISNMLGRLFNSSTLVDKPVGAGFTGPIFFNIIQQTNKLNELIRDIATALSVRFARGPNSTTIKSTVFATEPIVHVQWPWLSPTILLVATVFVALGLTIMHTRRHAENTIWKSSVLPLAVIPQELPPNAAPVTTQGSRVTELEARAERLLVKMDPNASTDMKWRLYDVQSVPGHTRVLPGQAADAVS